MASYPDSVKSFTTKNTGDSIQAGHVNDAQDEINAIEAGLLNGTARLNSSNSTLANLSVTGGSTFGALNSSNSTLANLSVPGGSTLGTLQIGASTFSVRPVTPPPHAALVYLASTVAASSGNSTLSWTAQEFLTNSSMHSTTTNPERLIPQSTGIYQAVLQVAFAINSTGQRQVLIRDSSGSFVAGQTVPASAFAQRVQVVAYKRFDVTGGYLTGAYQQDGASTLSLSSGLGETWLAMTKL